MYKYCEHIIDIQGNESSLIKIKCTNIKINITFFISFFIIMIVFDSFNVNKCHICTNNRFLNKIKFLFGKKSLNFMSYCRLNFIRDVFIYQLFATEVTPNSKQSRIFSCLISVNNDSHQTRILNGANKSIDYKITKICRRENYPIYSYIILIITK